MAEIISFYSYKGGVGRSLLLANVAVMLARGGRNVVCVDLDLEAGGLHTIFGIPRQKVRYSILDLLTLPAPPDIELAVRDITAQCVPGSKGQLHLLPAVTEAQKLAKLSHDALASNIGSYLSRIMDALLPNYILVDTRSGFADLGTNAALIRSDRVVCVLRPNRQNVDGLNMFLDVIRFSPNKLPYFLVLSQVPRDKDAPNVLSSIATLESLLGNDRHFDAQIRYTPKLALEENVLAITEPESKEAAAYRPVVDWLERRTL